MGIKKNIIFGIGGKVDCVIDLIKRIDVDIDYFVDNDSLKWETYFLSKPVKSPKNLLYEKEKCRIIISSSRYYDEIRKQLIDMGITHIHEVLSPEEIEKDIFISKFDRYDNLTTRANETQKKYSILYDSQAFSIQNVGGVSRYFYEIISKGTRRDDFSIDLFMGENNSSYSFDECKDKLNSFCCYHPEPINSAPNEYANRVMLRKFVSNKSYDIYHPTYYQYDSFDSFRIKIITVHDMIHELFQLSSTEVARKKNAICSADGIISVSENTKKDLINIYHVPEEKIKVIYHGNSLRINRKKTRTIKDPYILFVGHRNGYKNAINLMRAFSNSILLHDLKLCFFGGGVFSNSEKNLINDLGLNKRVLQFFGDDKLLSELYNHAELFVYPSLYEGFGIPILEAMHCGCPVITSGTSSMLEIGGDAARFFEPQSVDSIQETMEQVLEDSNLRKEMIQAGIKREKNFSWSKASKETFDFYTELLKKNN